jgi:hypothetical protein
MKVSGAPDHEPGGIEVDPASCQRMLDALVLTYGSIEDDPFLAAISPRAWQ